MIALTLTLALAAAPNGDATADVDHQRAVCERLLERAREKRRGTCRTACTSSSQRGAER